MDVILYDVDLGLILDVDRFGKSQKKIKKKVSITFRFALILIDYYTSMRKMKPFLTIILGITLLSSFVFATDLERAFQNPPYSARPGTWWHWMSGSVSKEGITADLEAMKKVGLRSAMLFSCGYEVPDGPIKFMSDEWRTLFKFAVKEANRLGLDFGVHNSDGWATSGGNWITPEQSMQKITASQITITGPGKKMFKLPKPPITTKPYHYGPTKPFPPFYRDIAVFGLKTTADDSPIDMSLATLTSTGNDGAVANLVDGKKDTVCILPKALPNTHQSITLQFPKPISARSLRLSSDRHYQAHMGELQVSADGVNYRLLNPFKMVVNEGSCSFSKTTSRFWRIVFTKTGFSASELRIAEIELSPNSIISNIVEKAGYHKSPHSRNVIKTPDSGHTAEALSRDSVIDLTDKFSDDGILDWDVPEGHWTILRLGHTITGARVHPTTNRDEHSYECDKMSKPVIIDNYNEFVGKLVKDVGSLAGNTFTHVAVDSWEAECQNWSDELIEQFKKHRGYDPTRFLPVTQGFIVDSEEISERFLWDFRRTLADLHADVFYKTVTELANADGLNLWSEVYNPANFDTFQSASRVDVPMTEFWFNRTLHRGFAKHAASVAHALGKPIVPAEAFTATPESAGWQAHPFALKLTADIAFADGVNQIIFHTWPHQPWPELSPGITLGRYGIQFTAQNTWFEQASDWVDYLTRCQFLLQQGQFLADVAIFSEEDAPNNLGRTDHAAREGVPNGYDYDYLNIDVLENATVENGRITLPSGMSYRLLVFKKSQTMTPKLARKVRDLVHDGALILGPKPKRSPSLVEYPRCDKEVHTIADDVWGDVDGKIVKKHSYGKGRVHDGMSIKAVLKSGGVSPDMLWTEGKLNWEHRQIDGDDFYFVSSREKKSVSTVLSLNIKGKIPEFWYPDTGKTEMCGVWRTEKRRTIIPLEIDPYGSLFIVFRKAGSPLVTDIKASFEHEGYELAITKAIYGSVLSNDPDKQVDVTRKIQAQVATGNRTIIARNELVGRDPAHGVAKRLDLEYTIGGKVYSKSIPESKRWTISPPLYASVQIVDEEPQLVVSENGTYKITTPSGTKSITVDTLLKPEIIAGPWSVAFPPNLGAPGSAVFTELISWPDHALEGIKYFSGTATYRTDFQVSSAMFGKGKQISIDLGRVEVIAELFVNGKPAGTLWKPPFRADISSIVKLGKNQLEIRVTNQWRNRLIGDAQLPQPLFYQAGTNGSRIKSWPEWLVNGQAKPDDGCITFTTYRHYKKDSKLFPAGLIGPVQIHCTEVLPVQSPTETKMIQLTQEKKYTPKIMIKNATYGVPNDPSKQINVTAKLQKLIDDKMFNIKVDNKLAGRDPAFGIEKMLLIEYTINEKLAKKRVKENGLIEFDTIIKEKSQR